jgi:cyclin H
LVDAFLEWKYRSYDGEGLLYGIEREDLVRIVEEVQDVIQSGKGEVDKVKVKEVDKKLKGCTNPEKVPGTALYVLSLSPLDYVEGDTDG